MVGAALLAFDLDGFLIRCARSTRCFSAISFVGSERRAALRFTRCPGQDAAHCGNLPGRRTLVAFVSASLSVCTHDSKRPFCRWPWVLKSTPLVAIAAYRLSVFWRVLAARCIDRSGCFFPAFITCCCRALIRSRKRRSKLSKCTAVVGSRS